MRAGNPAALLLCTFKRVGGNGGGLDWTWVHSCIPVGVRAHRAWLAVLFCMAQLALLLWKSNEHSQLQFELDTILP